MGAIFTIVIFTLQITSTYPQIFQESRRMLYSQSNTTISTVGSTLVSGNKPAVNGSTFQIVSMAAEHDLQSVISRELTQLLALIDGLMKNYQTEWIVDLPSTSNLNINLGDSLLLQPNLKFLVEETSKGDLLTHLSDRLTAVSAYMTEIKANIIVTIQQKYLNQAIKKHGDIMDSLTRIHRLIRNVESFVQASHISVSAKPKKPLLTPTLYRPQLTTNLSISVEQQHNRCLADTNICKHNMEIKGHINTTQPREIMAALEVFRSFLHLTLSVLQNGAGS